MMITPTLTLTIADKLLVLQESSSAKNVSAMDMQRRAACLREKTSKLRSPNFFVSKFRLSVHNLPRKVDDKKLKQIFLDAVKRKATKEQPIVRQAKVLMDALKKDRDTGLPMSKGMGFVEFAEHQHALVALRELNNNPSIFTAEVCHWSRPQA
jgi:nucleolar protein 4